MVFKPCQRTCGVVWGSLRIRGNRILEPLKIKNKEIGRGSILDSYVVCNHHHHTPPTITTIVAISDLQVPLAGQQAPAPPPSPMAAPASTPTPPTPAALILERCTEAAKDLD